MAREWRVFREGQFVGLMTAQEIRRGLREGIIDAQDLVCLDGSVIKRPVLDVEEIFEIEVSKPAQESPRFAHADRNAPPVSGKTTMVNKPVGKASKAAPPNKKHFFLRHRDGKALGPISGQEILGLYNKGLLGRKVRVEVKGQKKSLPIRQFVATYGQKNLKAMKKEQQGRRLVSPSLPLRKVDALRTNSIAAMSGYGTSRSVALVALVVGLMVGLVVYLYLPVDPWIDGLLGREERPRRLVIPKVVPSAVQPLGRGKHCLEGTLSQSNCLSTTLKPVPTMEKLERGKVLPLVPKPKPAKPLGPQVVPFPSTSPAPATPPPLIVPPAAGPETQPEQSPYQTANTGKKIVTPPAYFEIAQLEACPEKCTLNLRHQDGMPFRAVFFKSAHYESLRTKSQSVRVSGVLREDSQGFIVIADGFW